MKFKMNDRIFIIKQVSKNELWGDTGEAKTNDSNIFGKHSPYSQEILLSEELSKEQTRKTLIHELTHCYLWCYSHRAETFSEENICDIAGNSLDVIYKIVDKYMREYYV